MRVVIVTYNRFPDGDAGAVREFAFSRLLMENGFDVFVIGMGAPSQNVDVYKGTQFASLRIASKNKVERVLNYMAYTRRLLKYLEKYTDEFEVDCLWIVSLPIAAVIELASFAKKRNIRLVHDSVEWYSPEQFRLGCLSPAYIRKDINNRFLINKNFRVIAISKFLEDYYSRKGIKTVRIPVILDEFEIHSFPKMDERKLRIIYAGSPGKKDYLGVILEGFCSLNDDQLNRIEFTIIGVNSSEIEDLLSNRNCDISRIMKSLRVLGRVPRDVVLDNLVKSDFSVLLRPSKLRYAKAGFPTKIVESLMVGTPIISNLTSDLGDYIKDGENGFVVDDCSSNCISKTLSIVLETNTEVRLKMRENARRTFMESFFYKNYAEKLIDILQ